METSDLPPTRPHDAPTELLYALNDLPPLHKTVLYGAQWAVLFIPIITVSAGVVAAYLGFDHGEKTAFLGRILLVSGGVMVIQTLAGHRLPLIDGPSSVIMLVYIALAPLGLPAISGGFVAGGVLLALLGFLGLFRFVKMLFTDLVVGVITALIPLSLMPFIVPLIIGRSEQHPAGEPTVFLVSLFVMVAMVVFSNKLTGFHRSTSFLYSIALGTVLMLILGKSSMPEMQAVPWFRVPHPLVTSSLRFHPISIATFVLAYLAVLANEVGSIYSIAELVGKEGIERKLNRGIGFTGFGGALSGLLPGLGTVSYAISPGVVFTTRVGSRFALTACGALVMIMALCEKMNLLLSAIPLSIVGAALLVTMGSQIMVGMSIVFRNGGSLSARETFVVGVPLILGAAVSVIPHEFLDLLPLSLRVLVGNGLVVGVVTVLFLEHVMLRKPKA